MTGSWWQLDKDKDAEEDGRKSTALPPAPRLSNEGTWKNTYSRQGVRAVSMNELRVQGGAAILVQLIVTIALPAVVYATFYSKDSRLTAVSIVSWALSVVVGCLGVAGLALLRPLLLGLHVALGLALAAALGAFHTDLYLLMEDRCDRAQASFAGCSACACAAAGNCTRTALQAPFCGSCQAWPTDVCGSLPGWLPVMGPVLLLSMAMPVVWSVMVLMRMEKANSDLANRVMYARALVARERERLSSRQAPAANPVVLRHMLTTLLRHGGGPDRESARVSCRLMGWSEEALEVEWMDAETIGSGNGPSARASGVEGPYGPYARIAATGPLPPKASEPLEGSSSGSSSGNSAQDGLTGLAAEAEAARAASSTRQRDFQWQKLDVGHGPAPIVPNPAPNPSVPASAAAAAAGIAAGRTSVTAVNANGPSGSGGGGGPSAAAGSASTSTSTSSPIGAQQAAGRGPGVGPGDIPAAGYGGAPAPQRVSAAHLGAWIPQQQQQQQQQQQRQGSWMEQAAAQLRQAATEGPAPSSTTTLEPWSRSGDKKGGGGAGADAAAAGGHRSEGLEESDGGSVSGGERRSRGKGSGVKKKKIKSKSSTGDGSAAGTASAAGAVAGGGSGGNGGRGGRGSGGRGMETATRAAPTTQVGNAAVGVSSTAAAAGGPLPYGGNVVGTATTSTVPPAGAPSPTRTPILHGTAAATAAAPHVTTTQWATAAPQPQPAAPPLPHYMSLPSAAPARSTLAAASSAPTPASAPAPAPAPTRQEARLPAFASEASAGSERAMGLQLDQSFVRSFKTPRHLKRSSAKASLQGGGT